MLKKLSVGCPGLYLQPFWHSSPMKGAPQPKIAKKTLKPSVLKVQGHRCWHY